MHTGGGREQNAVRRISQRQLVKLQCCLSAVLQCVFNVVTNVKCVHLLEPVCLWYRCTVVECGRMLAGSWISQLVGKAGQC